MLRIRSCVPLPHFSEHAPHSPHLPHLQSAENMMKCVVYIMGWVHFLPFTHPLLSVDAPEHPIPPFKASCSMLLNRNWLPPEQTPQFPHWPHLQSAGKLIPVMTSMDKDEVIKEHIPLEGHSLVLQACSSDDEPVQAFPPFRDGWEINLVRNWVPPPHFSEHEPHLPHSLHLQSAENIFVNEFKLDKHWCIELFINYAPFVILGQGSGLQACSFQDEPSHFLPPFKAGWAMNLVCLWVPPPHFSEQEPHCPHWLHLQSTENGHVDY